MEEKIIPRLKEFRLGDWNERTLGLTDPQSITNLEKILTRCGYYVGESEGKVGPKLRIALE